MEHRAHPAELCGSSDPTQIARSYDEDTAHWLGALVADHDPNGVLHVGQVMREPV
ncbi:hypothetical protein [Rhodococcus tukisamuensis]|uniref:Uncharacterized protein n=1 Tax=Rhodococcus tukisamuensis TaxID=168276 RepID=A0A1G7EDL8_9NOCA|nr:hypothetical protein [Rhodococcus tukisamuensis]SDE61566.1 hypothetical protein SAMN05444580_12351 [Rhodococcus tukisamuensis]